MNTFNPPISKQLFTYIAVFLLLNFLALYVGGLFTGKGVGSDWYRDLEKAPWTPAGWVFGLAWTTIMVCFSIYMGLAWEQTANKTLLIGLFILQLTLNIGWNPVFFHFHQVLLALLMISALSILIAYFFIFFWQTLKVKSLLILPYLIWLIIATSLNVYIVLKN